MFARAAVGSVRLKTRTAHRVRRLLRAALWLGGGSAALLVTALAWYFHRPQPKPVTESLFVGVTYTRTVTPAPHALILHFVDVDLTAPGVGFLVTPGDPASARPLRARKTSTFLKEFGVQVAVNGDYFFPFRSNGIHDYYPHEGDPVELEGYAWSRGIQYSHGGAERHRFPVLYIAKDNRVSFERPSWPIENAVSGICMLLRDGRDAVPWPETNKREPCTAVAVSRDGKRLFLCKAEGRQPNYSEGVSLHRFAQIVRDHGGWNALDLDGGGSETLVVADEANRPRLLNCPIDHHLPGWERPVANHLGIYASRRR